MDAQGCDRFGRNFEIITTNHYDDSPFLISGGISPYIPVMQPIFLQCRLMQHDMTLDKMECGDWKPGRLQRDDEILAEDTIQMLTIDV